MKTANIQILQSKGQSRLEVVQIRKMLEYAGEAFFIHRGSYGKTWTVSHYQTGFATVKNARTMKEAEEKFLLVMERQKKNLHAELKRVISQYGVANKLPTEDRK